MNACQDLAVTASAGVGPALSAVDCFANQTAANAFGRLFGTQGSLLPALTILLTLYIAFFAISLLTGRTRLGVSALTPRMMTLGLVLTFATSWVAYQGVVWNLTIGSADQLAAILTGTNGSATAVFAGKLDLIFNAIASTASQAGQGGQAAPGGPGLATPTGMMWLAAIILLLGTVGVLVTARIALAILLAVGPVFVVMALFGGTRGLFVGWMRGLVMTALTPLFVVVGGSITLELVVPLVAGLANGVEINGQAAIGLFLVACVHMALMVMAGRIGGTMVAGWTVFGLAGNGTAERSALAPSPVTSLESPAAAAAAAQAAALRERTIVAPVADPVGASAPAAATHRESRVVTGAAPQFNPSLPPLPAQRARGVGSRFRAAPSTIREMKA
ncbi:MAG TPA: type IV secretion system protein [Croceicoccus sp.]|nr:type IV secretion system protein [Croceicoccus sp.]